MEKKTILLVHNYYQIGGGEHTVFENEKNLLLQHGHSVETYTRSNDELKQAKWKMLILPFTTTWSWKTWREVRKIIREKHIDVVHCHNTFPLVSPSVYYAARSMGVPVVQTIHNFRFLCPNGLFYRDGQICESCREGNSFCPALRHGCYRDSKVQTAVAVAMLRFHRWIGTYRKINYIFLTEFNRDKFRDLLDIGGENVFIKPNFVARTPVCPKRQTIQNKFIYAGRLDENKGVPFLLKAWKDLPEDFQLHIYGDGTYRPDCEKAAAEQKNIHFYGFRPQQEIFADLSDAAALLFPSECYETFGLSWAESFAVGKPVVATDLGSHGQMIRQSGGGTLYEVGNTASFAAALENVVARNGDYAQKAKDYYEENLTPEKNYEKLCDIYERAKIDG